MKNLIDIATDPEQYAQGKAATWIKDKERQRLQEENFWTAIEPFIPSLCKSALDIGCGSGWSAHKFADLGTLNWIGLEPSSIHFETTEKIQHKFQIRRETLANYNSDMRFDCIIAIMVFSHIGNVKKSLEKISKLLNPDGTFIMIFSTFHEGSKREERNGRKYQVEVIDNDQYADKAIEGAYGIADINRRPEYYIKAATSAGLRLERHLKVEDVGYSPKELLVFKTDR